MSLVDTTLSKVQSAAQTKIKNSVVSSTASVFDNIYKIGNVGTNSISSVIPHEGANEASKRFLMYQQHTNRPKSSQQFYVLFQPRTDLLYSTASGSQLIADLKAWGQKQLNNAKNWLKSQFSNDDANEVAEKRAPSWMDTVAEKVKSVGKDLNDLYKTAKQAVSDAANWVNKQLEYVFGTSNKLIYPPTFNNVTSGWLSQFATDITDRTKDVEFGLFADADTQEELNRMCDEISMHCVDTDRPSWEIQVNEYNQYNRKRLVYGKTKYEPIVMTFYDTLDSALLKLLLFQLAFINDSYLKEYGHFKEYTVLENFLNNPQNWGSNMYTNTSIFECISLVEIFGDQCTVFNLMNPKISKVKLSKADATKSDVHKITITIEYEGLTNLNPITLGSNNYDVMLAWAMADSSKAAKISEKCRMTYQSSVQGAVSLAKGFFGPGSVKEKIQNLGTSMGLGSQVKLAQDLINGSKNGSGGLIKQLTNPSSITSKIGRLF